MSRLSLLLVPLSVLTAAGCDFSLPEIDLSPAQECESYAELIDETTGEIAFSLEREDDCEVLAFPNGVTYSRVLDDVERPGDACNTATEVVYEVRDLSEHQLRITPFVDGPGRVATSNPEGLQQNDWVSVTYLENQANGSSSYGSWQLVFQFGVEGSAFSLDDCWDGRGNPVDPITGDPRGDDW